MRPNNPGWIVDIGQIIAQYTCFYPVLDFIYANYHEFASKKSPFGSG